MHKAAMAALLLFLTAVPWLPSMLAGDVRGHDQARLAQAALLVLCGVALIGHRHARGGRLQSMLWLGTACLVGIALWHAPKRIGAAVDVSSALGLFALGSVVRWASAAEQRSILLAASASSCLFGLLVLLLAMAARHLGSPLDLLGVFPGYDNYRFFNHVQTVALPLVAVSTYQADRRLKAVAWVALVVGFAFIYATTARATLLAIAVALASLLFMFGKSALEPVCRMGFGAVGGLLVCWATFGLSLGSHHETTVPVRNELASDHARLYLWKTAIEQVLESPALGIGAMEYANRPNEKASHPHNFYLQAAAELGLIGLGWLLILGWNGFKRLRLAVGETSEAPHKTTGMLLVAGCCAASVDAAFSGNLVMPVSQVWIATTFGLSAAWLSSTRSNGLARTERPWGVGILVAVLIAGSQLWLLCRSISQFPDLQQRIEQSDVKGPNRRTQPRYWSDGSY